MNKTVTKILLIRHGETEWNREIRIQGNKNSPLTEKGIKQALDAGEKLNKIEIDSVYSSPLERAFKTAEIIVKDRNFKIIKRDNLREINFGPWEGRTKKEIKISDPSEYYNFMNRPDHFSLNGAETCIDVQKRIVSEINNILDKNTGKTILVVSHGISIITAALYFSGLSLSDLSSSFTLSNGEILIIKKEGEKITVSKDTNLL